jgi:hypothetical protein
MMMVVVITIMLVLVPMVVMHRWRVIPIIMIIPSSEEIDPAVPLCARGQSAR